MLERAVVLDLRLKAEQLEPYVHGHAGPLVWPPRLLWTHVAAPEVQLVAAVPEPMLLVGLLCHWLSMPIESRFHPLHSVGVT